MKKRKKKRKKVFYLYFASCDGVIDVDTNLKRHTAITLSRLATPLEGAYIRDQPQFNPKAALKLQTNELASQRNAQASTSFHLFFVFLGRFSSLICSRLTLVTEQRSFDTSFPLPFLILYVERLTERSTTAAQHVGRCFI